MTALAGSLTVLSLICLAATVALVMVRGQRGRAMRVMERLPLDGKRALYLVEVAGKCLLVGAGESGLSMLAEVDPSRLPVDDEPRHPLRVAWAQLVKRGAR